MGTLVIATSNLGKLDEFKEMFKDLPVELKCLADYPPLPPPNENGRTFAANAKIKAAYYAKNLKEFCLADDSGLEVKALDGAPGVRSARFAGDDATDKQNNDLLLQQMKFQITRTCRFRCALAVANPTGRIVSETDGSCVYGTAQRYGGSHTGREKQDQPQGQGCEQADCHVEEDSQ